MKLSLKLSRLCDPSPIYTPAFYCGGSSIAQIESVVMLPLAKSVTELVLHGR
jgi:hypothetical protein